MLHMIRSQQDLQQDVVKKIQEENINFAEFMNIQNQKIEALKTENEEFYLKQKRMTV